ncbi:MAG: (Fe-S)-binding protein [Bacillota bacterium]
MLRYEIIGMGACLADGAKIRVTAMLSESIGQLLPYINAVVRYASFDPGGMSFTFKFRGCPVILEPRRVVAGQLDDLDTAEEVLDYLIEFLNRVQSKKVQINPVFNPKPLPQPVEIVRLLPGTNCGQCGEQACVAFALKLALGQQQPDSCLSLTGDEIRKVLDAIEALNDQQVEV